MAKKPRKSSTKKISRSSKPLVAAMLHGDKRALARLMTYVDNRHEDLMSLMTEIYLKTGRALRIGITGPPGGGKSTLVDKLIKHYRREGKTVGVVAIDPSSPFSGGAVLGDRIRMMEHAGDEGVFIRSLGSRGSHGGVSRATRDIVRLLDAFGFDLILIETVGVGQTELDIMSVAQTTVVVLVPEAGDTIQTMKAGIMEIADIFVVNKSDREGGERIVSELKALSEMQSGDWKIPVLPTVATRDKGVTDLLRAISEHLLFISKIKKKERFDELLKEECLDIFHGETIIFLNQHLTKGGAFGDIYSRLTDHHQNPYLAASELMERLGWNSGINKPDEMNKKKRL